MSKPAGTTTPPPAENEDESEYVEPTVPQDHLIALLHHRHAFTSVFTTADEKAAAKDAILAAINEHNMRPFWQLMHEVLGFAIDEAKARAMDEANEKRLAELDARIKDAQENLGDVEVREGLLAKCDFFARIGDLDACVKFNEECSGKTLATGPKLDLCFQRIRLGIAFGNNDVAAKGIQDAHKLAKDADWERRNRLKVYEGLYYVLVRDFAKAAQLLLDSLTTFASTELLSFNEFIALTVVVSLPVLSRKDLKAKIVDSPEVLSATGLGEIPNLLAAIYQCRYRDVFRTLDGVCQQLRRVVFTSVHVNYFFREVRVLALTQFLDSYSSVTLASMSAAFSIPVPVLDQMLCTLISNERLACKIDRVTGSVRTFKAGGSSGSAGAASGTDAATNAAYHKLVKNGDLLLNRIQKLSRLIEM